MALQEMICPGCQKPRFVEIPGSFEALCDVCRKLNNPPVIHEYAFDVMLKAVVRVRAESVEVARNDLDFVDCVYVDKAVGTVIITEVSLADNDPRLFEVDGKMVKGQEDAEDQQADLG